MNEYTGSHIGLGIVFLKDKQETIKNALLELTKKYVSKEYTITNYCNKTDESKEYSTKDLTDECIEELIVKDYFTIKFETQILNEKTQILISNNIIEKNYAIQINFHEESLLNCFNNNYSECTKYIDNLVVSLLEKFKFEYAFCDNNAIFEISDKDQNYSLVYTPKNQNLEVVRQSWEIDGFSERDNKIIGKFILKVN